MSIIINAKRDMLCEPVFVKYGEIPKKVGCVVTSDGRVFPAQKKNDGIIILASAARGAEITAEISENTAGSGVEIVDRPKESKLEINIGGKLFTSYIYGGFAKPFLGRILTRDGASYTRFEPNAHEHPHQRSVFVAVGDVNGLDFWNESEEAGIEKHKRFERILNGNAFGTFTADNLWTSKDGAPQLDERRTFTFYAQGEECRYIDLEIEFRASYGNVVFGTTKEAGPLGIRVNEEMRADATGSFVNSYGAENEAECWGRAASWCDYSGNIRDKKYGIAVFDNENNERYPTAWHIRDYGLFAANNLYFKGGFIIKSGETLTYEYRLVFYENKINAKDRFILYSKDGCGK